MPKVARQYMRFWVLRSECSCLKDGNKCVPVLDSMYVIPVLTLGSFLKQRAAGMRGRKFNGVRRAERRPGGQATGWANR